MWLSGARVGTQLHTKLLWPSVRWGRVGLPSPCVTIFLTTSLTKISPSLPVLCLYPCWSEASHQILKALQGGDRRKGTHPMTSLFFFFSSHCLLLVLSKITPTFLYPKIQVSIYTVIVSFCLHTKLSSWKLHKVISQFYGWEFQQGSH